MGLSRESSISSYILHTAMGFPATGPPHKATRQTTIYGPPWLASLGLRCWYTYLVYPQHSDVFVWEPSDLSGVPREVIEHHLAVCPKARAVKQKVRCQAKYW
jgi:hypothetical protein